MTLQIDTEIRSFRELPGLADRSRKMVLLVRHSYRKSLQEGTLDPGLTEEGWAYAKECGSFLRGLKDVCYGASSRTRTVQTIQALMEGGSLEPGEIREVPGICDTALFEYPEALGESIVDGSLPEKLRQYYFTGKAETVIDLPVFHKKLMDFLMQTEFEKKNVILASHDIIIASLLLPLKIYPFTQSDWCGYIQGILLCQSADGNWTASYVVPDKENRKITRLFI